MIDSTNTEQRRQRSKFILYLFKYNYFVSQTLEKIRQSVGQKQVQISAHGYDELANDELTIQEILAGISDALILEDYPDYHKGPCVLVLQKGNQGKPIHVVWGLP